MAPKMPVLFVGHGSPMNAIEKNPFTAEWEALAARLPRPEAILCVSAHWFTSGTRIVDLAAPGMIYDMYGFPDALYRVAYAAPGAPETARRTKALLGDAAVLDDTWGFDHGAWSVLCRIYPQADIPVFQLSVDRNAAPATHLALGRKLRALRGEGVLILGSGNIVHNLGRVDWRMDGGYVWAGQFDRYVRDNVLNRSEENILHYERSGVPAGLAFSSPDHFAPFLYALGASDESDSVRVFNEACVMGALSMTSYQFG